MIHLVSSDPAQPQVTIVLADDAISGWTSDGRTFGWTYFHPSLPTGGSVLGLALLRGFTRGLR